MNPFEDGIVGTIGLHAVMSQSIAMGNSRTVQGVDYPFFYNPMWGHFGDRNAGPDGTYYRSSAEHVNYFWNIFDQVLIRPELIDVFAKDELQILDHDGGGVVGVITKHSRQDKFFRSPAYSFSTNCLKKREILK